MQAFRSCRPDTRRQVLAPESLRNRIAEKLQDGSPVSANEGSRLRPKPIKDAINGHPLRITWKSER